MSQMISVTIDVTPDERRAIAAIGVVNSKPGEQATPEQVRHWLMRKVREAVNIAGAR